MYGRCILCVFSVVVLVCGRERLAQFYRSSGTCVASVDSVVGAVAWVASARSIDSCYFLLPHTRPTSSRQALEDKYGGWLNASIVPAFEAYADTCFREFGGKVCSRMGSSPERFV